MTDFKLVLRMTDFKLVLRVTDFKFVLRMTILWEAIRWRFVIVPSSGTGLGD
jgi:hypothetical protein